MTAAQVEAAVRAIRERFEAAASRHPAPASTREVRDVLLPDHGVVVGPAPGRAGNTWSIRSLNGADEVTMVHQVCLGPVPKPPVVQEPDQAYEPAGHGVHTWPAAGDDAGDGT